MSNSLNDFLPKTRFQLPEGDSFSIGTIWDQDSLRQLVLFQYFSADEDQPLVAFAISASSSDAVITALQDSANQARFISGQRTYVYPPPVQEDSPLRSKMKVRKPLKKATKAKPPIKL